VCRCHLKIKLPSGASVGFQTASFFVVLGNSFASGKWILWVLGGLQNEDFAFSPWALLPPCGIWGLGGIPNK